MLPGRASDSRPAASGSARGRLSLCLFGPFEARVDGVPLPRLRSRRGEWLLALLALRGGQEIERHWLAGVLWPESSQAQARTNLRVTLKDLRRALGPAAGCLNASAVLFLALDLGTTDVDVVDFDRAVAQGDASAVERAVALYRGPLLEECGEEWAFQERLAREQAYLTARERLAATALASGDLVTAGEHLRRATAVDPLRETAQRALMQVLAAGGNYAAAMQVYRELRLGLHRELNAAPDPETQTLFERLRAEAREKAGVGGQGSGVSRVNGSSLVTAGPVRTRTDSRPLTPGPSDTVTFLFADIAGSTRLWEQHPDAMPEALARHDSLLRQAIEAHGGTPFKAVGDLCCAAFPTAPTALHAALAVQQALQDFGFSILDFGLGSDAREGISRREPLTLSGNPKSKIENPKWIVRMALHTGTALEREGDYLGPALNRVARLLAAAHGGQILLSRATQELVWDDLPEGASLRDLGSHRLKDLQQPEHLFQLLHPSFPTEFSSVRSLEAFAHNLPVQVTSFIGREAVIAEVKRLLTTTRLLTLTGAGGCGKTRLAVQVAADLLSGENDGAWLVDLAPLADPALVPQAVASVLGIREEPGRPLTQTLVDALLPKKLLLILDNCEHLLEGCAALAEALVRRCPGVQILATSRERLNIAGETTYRVPSLSSADPRSLPPALVQLVQYEAVRLFIDRAIAAVTAFAVTNENAPAVAEVCHRLDGIPLAIELAAARVRVLSVEQIAARLDDRFRLLTGGSRTALPRQQTLRALIDWSYDLLSESERILLRRLSVFAGGWTLEAAEAVCSDEGCRVKVGTREAGDGCRHGRSLSTLHPTPYTLQPDDVLDLLTALVDKSLVAEEPGAETRFRLLETIREYALERLAESGEAEALRRQHAELFLALAEAAEPHLGTAKQNEWLDRLEREYDNLRAALTWSCTGTEAAVLLARLAGALWAFWANRGHWMEERRWLEAALARSGGLGRTRVWAKLLSRAGAMAGWHHSEAALARARLEEGVVLWRELEDIPWLAESLGQLSQMVTMLEDYAAARPLAEESVALRRELGDPHGLLWSLYFLGNVAVAMGDIPAARAHYEESRAIGQALGDRFSLARPVCGLAEIARRQGDYAAARAFLKETVALRREQRDAHVGWFLDDLAAMTRDQGDLAAARSLYEEALSVHRERGARPGIVRSLAGLGTVARYQGDHEAARSYIEQSAAVIQELGNHEREVAGREAIAACLEGLAGVTVFEAEQGSKERREGRAPSAGAGEARLKSAARWLGAASALREAGNVPLSPMARAENERQVAALQAALGDAAFAAAWAEGRVMTVERLLAQAAGGTDPSNA